MSATKADGSPVNLRLENHIVPVTDVDRAKAFYQQLGWRLDDDVAPIEGIRFVQFTPPGSGTSITFGLGLTAAAPGSIQGTLVVTDIQAAHDELAGRGIDVSDVWHGPPFPVEARQPGPDPERTSYGSFCSFNDPDGNLWIVQEVTTRLPGRIDPAKRHSPPRETWRTRSGAPRPPMSSTKSIRVAHIFFTAPAKTTPGPPGTPPTWSLSRLAAICRLKRFQRYPPLRLSPLR